jgi:pimeloyl-ACP methyl ester carboxylesterase
MSGAAATFVLVHGAWQGNWVWERVASGLRAAGQTVFTPSLTGIGERAHLSGPSIDLDTHIADVLGTIEHHELDRIVLVGHSYGGMVIGGVADRIPRRIVSLVFLDAFIPVAGKSILDFLPPEQATAFRAGAEKEGQVGASSPSRRQCSALPVRTTRLASTGRRSITRSRRWNRNPS